MLLQKTTADSPPTKSDTWKACLRAPETELLALRAERARRSLYEFVMQGWPILEPATPFVNGMHVEAICQHLQAVSEGQIGNLIINVPPGHAKSLLAGVFWPAWVWIHRPQTRWLFASYSATLSVRDSVRCRRLIESEWYQECWGHIYHLSADQNEKHRFENDRTGYRIATSVGGTATGERADILVVDDPHSVEQAESDSERRKAVEWFNGTMSTRLNDFTTGHKVVIQQRLHEADLTGDLLAKGGFELLCLPTEFEPDRRCTTCIGWTDPRTQPGELLWPDKVTAAQIGSLKTSLGSYRYAGQYQQRPAPASGGIFQRTWFRFWQPAHMDLPPVSVRMPDGQMASIQAVPLPEEFDSQIQSWDLAFKDKATSDYVVGQVWASKGADRFLLDQRRERMDMPQTKEAIRMMSAKWPKAGAKLVEDKANGPAVIQELQHEISGLIKVTPEGGKIARAHAVSAQAESGNIYLPHPAIRPWVDGFVEEATAFPNARNDDQVDAMTQALHRLRGMRANFGVPESQIVVEPFLIPDSWPRAFVITVTPTAVAVLWGARDQNGDIFLYAEHRLPHAEPAENACAIIQQGDWIPGVVHAPSLKGSLAEKNNVTQLYREKGLRVHTARMGEEPGFYHLLQLLKAQKLKVFGSLNGFLSEYRTGDESALLLQCCYVLLASGRQYMRPKVAPQLVDSRSSVHWGERDWMA
jgi:predicted phage terminase large subunit-like protein